MEVTKTVTKKFKEFIFDWAFETYLLVGGYGSGKSYQCALKIILRCIKEKTKVLVVRNVYNSHKESTYDLIDEIITGLGLTHKVRKLKSPIEYIFWNGSRIIFKGMDDPAKSKSINGVAVVWIEECSEVKYDGYKELLGRLRTPGVSLNYILSCNPVGRENWVYRHFFVRLDDEGNETVILDEETFYRQGQISLGKVYYHHSTPDDNPFLTVEYIERLDDIKNYDKPLWRVARYGRFGAAGTRVLPQFNVAGNIDDFNMAITVIPEKNRYYGFDFGFEESYNAVISMAVDLKNKILYIYDEIYLNKITDDKFAQHPKMIEHKAKEHELSADSEDPKAIAYYRQQGFNIRKCKKFAGSRLSYTRKVKRFRQIICSPKCINTIRELKDLTYKKDTKGNVMYDEFNIDPHTFSAVWYGLDRVTVADVKERKSNSRRGRK